MPPKVKNPVIKKPKVKKQKSNNLNIDMHTANNYSLPTMKTVTSVVDGKTIYPFYTTRYPFSNFYPVEFTATTFYSSEQYFMYRKATQFNDAFSQQQLLKERDPKACKSIGRQVRNFDKDVWTSVSFGIMLQALRAKFSHNQNLKDYLLATGDGILVESAPRDRLWGIGMGENNPDVADPAKWKGRNLLGKALMQVRDEFKAAK
ncbi:NADAR domain-containing protein [Aphelenchoides bicaudatus]|nr:NADAR domain-containing protein [Aphelenchoides bicaudatus]